MKSSFARAIGALAVVTALVVATWPPWPTRAQANAPVISTPVISSTASSGTSGVLALDGKYPNCAIYAQTSTATATVQAYGNTLTGQYGPSSPNTTLGSAVTATTTQSATQVNTASAPVGLYFTWSGNSGTFTAWATCSSSSSTVFSGTVTAVVPTPLNVTIAAPTDAGGNVKVTAQNTAPAGPLPTASAGAAPPASTINVNSYDNCVTNTGGISAVTAGNATVLHCDALGNLEILINPWCNTFATSGAIASAVSTKLVSNVAGKQIYVCLTAWESTGTNTTNNVQWEWGTKTTNECDTGTVTLFPAAVQPGTATGEWTSGWGGSAASNILVGVSPGVAPVPLIIPTAQDFCGVTAGTTTAGKFTVYYGIRTPIN